MPDDIIARAEAALEGISPGPWKIRFNGHWAHVVMTPNGCVWNPDTGKVNDRRNGEFIAAARQLVPELVAELKTTRAQLAAAPDRMFTDDLGRRWEWCGGVPGTWAWRITSLGAAEAATDA